jgi:phosphinothricin acetyltransferase
MNIRVATPQDAAALVSIYAPYVEHTPISFETVTPSPEEFADRIAHTLEKYPYLVSEEGGEITGYAYASAFKWRAAYDWSVETSIYVKEGMGRRGIGSALYGRLEELLFEQNICNVCACITYPNPASISFHEAHGYHLAAHFTASGYKLGAWHDMVWMEKTLKKHEIPPCDFIPFSRLV